MSRLQSTRNRRFCVGRFWLPPKSDWVRQILSCRFFTPNSRYASRRPHMKHPIKIVLTTLALALMSDAFSQPHDWPIMSFPGPNGKQFGFYVSDAMFRKTPEWLFDGTTAPPLWSYTLQRAGSSQSANRWYYTFDFTPDVAGMELSAVGFSSMLLLDGTVIEPLRNNGMRPNRGDRANRCGLSCRLPQPPSFCPRAGCHPSALAHLVFH
jgi:hypothetical protein